jgi:predicted acetylornithine/succinylornithine family transaminase
MDHQEVLDAYAASIQHTYGKTPLVFVRGEGCRLWDDQGKRYLDWVSGGRAGTALGNCHPDVKRALAEQLETLMFVSNDFYHPWAARLGQLLAARSGGRKAFFCNSGAEASETALKLARKWAHTQYGPDRFEILTTEGSFHGRTMGALSMTGQTKFHQGFQPMLPGFRHVPFNDAGALEAAIGRQTCAVYLEPVQGESGIYPADPQYLPAVEALCRKHGLLFMLDEVQSGFGRTGRFWAYEHYGVEPDVVTLAKALGGGLPIGACLAKPEVCALVPGDHGCTFGGNPFSAAAAVAALEALDRHEYLSNAAAQGEAILARLREWQRSNPKIKEARGLGLMLGIEFTGTEGKAVVAGCLERALLVHPVGETIVRILPAICITRAEVEEGLGILHEAIGAASG